MELILDIGSGRSLHKIKRAEEMIRKVARMDTKKHNIVFKAQLFSSAPPNIPLEHDAFAHLYTFCAYAGYHLTASVFDLDSLRFLLNFDPLFVKIACRKDLYWLIGEVPRKIPVYVSEYKDHPRLGYNINDLLCVPEYPASSTEYLEQMAIHKPDGISDHTVGWGLYSKIVTQIWEKHLCPEREESNPDAGPFAVTPEELEGII
jgi:sialic acid synthase SpsE